MNKRQLLYLQVSVFASDERQKFHMLEKIEDMCDDDVETLIKRFTDLEDMLSVGKTIADEILQKRTKMEN